MMRARQRMWLHGIALAVVMSAGAMASGFVRQQRTSTPQISKPGVASKPRPILVASPQQQEASWQVLGLASLDDSGLLLHQTDHVTIKSPFERGLSAVTRAIRNPTIGKIIWVTNVLTSTALLGSGLVTRFSTVPAFMGPIHHLWLGSTLLTTSLSLAQAATKHQPVPVRNWIMSFQVMAICLSCLADWAGPFRLGFLKNPVISRAVFCRVSGVVSLFNIKNIQSGSKLIEHRKDKAYKVPRIVDGLAYVMPNAVGLVWSGYLAWFVGLRHSKHSYVNFLAKAPSDRAALAYYTCVISALSAVAAPWVAHLRESKVFTKRSEIWANLGISIICFWINGLALSAGLWPLPKFSKGS